MGASTATVRTRLGVVAAALATGDIVGVGVGVFISSGRGRVTIVGRSRVGARLIASLLEEHIVIQR